jgi:hypothetical protein
VINLPRAESGEERNITMWNEGRGKKESGLEDWENEIVSNTENERGESCISILNLGEEGREEKYLCC